MGAPYVDGTFPSGCPIITLGTVPYKCESISFNNTTSKNDYQAQDGSHSGSVVQTGPTTGSAKVQYANINIPDPQTCAANSITGVFQANVNGSNANVMIMGVAIDKQPLVWSATLDLQVKVN